MKSLIYTFLALFIWTMVPVDAIASRNDHKEHRSSSYRESSDHDRRGNRHKVKKGYRKHQHQKRHHRPQHWRPATRIKYVPAPVYRSYVVPSGFIYSTNPGVTLFFSW